LEARRIPLEEALAESFRLGELGLSAFQAAQGVDRETAIRLLERRKQQGRVPSKCMSEIIG